MITPEGEMVRPEFSDPRPLIDADLVLAGHHGSREIPTLISRESSTFFVLVTKSIYGYIVAMIDDYIFSLCGSLCRDLHQIT